MKSIRTLVEGRDSITIFQDETVAQAAAVLAKYDIGAIPVLTHGTNELAGIFSERDLLKRVIVPGLDPRSTVISQVMTSELLSAHIDESTEVCMAKMKDHRVRHLLVTDGKRLIGVLSMRDLMHAEVTEKLELIESLQEYIVGKPLLRSA